MVPGVLLRCPASACVDGAPLTPRTLTSGSSPTGNKNMGYPVGGIPYFGIYYTI